MVPSNPPSVLYTVRPPQLLHRAILRADDRTPVLNAQLGIGYKTHDLVTKTYNFLKENTVTITSNLPLQLSSQC